MFLPRQYQFWNEVTHLLYARILTALNLETEKEQNAVRFYAFKGAQQATRYEVAAMVARAAAAGEAKHASKKDVELLKKLSVEFKSELEALGAKTDKLDKRVTKLEKGIGSWQITGRFKFDFKSAMGDRADNMKGSSQFTRKYGSNNEFTKEYARLYFRRQINESTYFDSEFRIGAWASGDNNGGHRDENVQSFNKFYIGTKLPFWGLNARIGRFSWDWEGEYGLVNAFDSLWGDYRGDAFEISKKWNKVSAVIVAYRDFNNECFQTGYFQGSDRKYTDAVDKNTMNIGIKLDYKADKWFIAGLANWMMANGDGKKNDGAADVASSLDGHLNTYGVYAGYKFTQDIALKGAFYWQNSDKLTAPSGKELDTGKAFKVVLDIKQPALKFTSLWVEYARINNSFLGNIGENQGGVSAYNYGFKGDSQKGILWGVEAGKGGVRNIWNIRAAQKWTKKFSTELIYMNANIAGVDGQATKAYGINASYKLNPAVTTTLGFDTYDYGDGNGFGHKDKDQVLFFRTDVKF